MPSPCIDVCRLDKGYAYCIGCLRTSEEIGRWMTYSDSERDRIITELPTRLEALFAT